MAKKRDGKKKEPELPKFDGFRPLSGLKELKDQLAAKKAEEAAKAGKANVPSERGAKGSSSASSSSSARPKTEGRQGERGAAKSGGDDDLSFHRMMSGVTPLSSGKERVPVSHEARATRAGERAAEAKAKIKADTDAVLDHLHRLVDDTARFEVSDDGRRIEGRRVDTPPNLVRTLRRGLLPIDARLDLHGLSAEAAREKVLAFLREMRTRGERCVLVIHGKGERHAGAGVLRGEIGAWLSQGRAREYVAAFATATDADGGEGAVYVALRR